MAEIPTPPPPDDEAAALARRCAEYLHEANPAARSLGIAIEEMGPGFARLSLEIRHDMVNGHDVCHGGLIFTLADTALAYASHSGNRVAVTGPGVIDFISPACRGDVLFAAAKETEATRSTGIYDVRVTNQGGATVALLRGRALIRSEPVLPEEP